MNQYVSVRQEGNKVVFIVDIASYLKSLITVPIKSVEVSAQDGKIVITAEIDSEELIKRAQMM